MTGYDLNRFLCDLRDAGNIEWINKPLKGPGLIQLPPDKVGNSHFTLDYILRSYFEIFKVKFVDLLMVIESVSIELSSESITRRCTRLKGESGVEN